jgi:hypothetical protein
MTGHSAPTLPVRLLPTDRSFRKRTQSGAVSRSYIRPAFQRERTGEEGEEAMRVSVPGVELALELGNVM